MQAHSAAALLLSHYVWNRHYGKVSELPKQISVSIARPQASKTSTLYMKIEQFEPKMNDDGYITEFKVKIFRAGHCILQIVRKNSPSADSTDVIVSHSEQHKGNMKEEFTLMRSSLNGRHAGGHRYTSFHSSNLSETGKKGKFKSIVYKDLEKKYQEIWTIEAELS